MSEQIGGNKRGPQELSLERVLDAAQQIYLARGYLPMYLASDLMSRGCIVEELENKWDEEVRTMTSAYIR